MDYEYVLLDANDMKVAIRNSLPAPSHHAAGSIEAIMANMIHQAFADFVITLEYHIDSCKIPQDEFVIIKVGAK